MTLVRLKGGFDREADVDRAINDFQSDTAEIEGSPEPWMARSTLYVCTAMFIAAIAWANFATIDKVVSARGKLISNVPNITIQPLETSIVRSVLVRPGDIVKAGQTLATLDPTFAQADLAQLNVRLQALDAQVARLEAEEAGKPFVASLEKYGEMGPIQESLWRNRQTQLRAQMSSFDERVARTRATIASARRQKEFLAAQLSEAKEIEEIRKTLAASQIGSKLNALAASASRLSVEGTLSQAAASEKENEHLLDDLKAQREAALQEWRNQVTQDLVLKRTERDQILEQLNKAQMRQNMVTLTAPSDAVVLDVAARSINSIIREAEPMFTLVPVDAPLEANVAISGSEIGFVREGDPVHLKLDAYDFFRHGMVEGVVKVISEDSFATDSENKTLAARQDAMGGLVYRARVDITSINLRDVPEGFRLVPGLPLTADIKVGSRSVMAYFLRPLMMGLTESMREP